MVILVAILNDEMLTVCGVGHVSIAQPSAQLGQSLRYSIKMRTYQQKNTIDRIGRVILTITLS